MPSARVEFTADPKSVGDARRFVRRALGGWDAEELDFEASLVVSELVSNGIIHARTPITLELDLDGPALRVSVTDGSARAPRRKSHGPEAATGRGLALVEACSRSWGVETRPGGKTVWAVLDMDGSRTADRGPAPGPGRPGRAPTGDAPPPGASGWQVRSAGPAVRAA